MKMWEFMDGDGDRLLDRLDSGRKKKYNNGILF
jgi:hypothetical protein